MTDTLASESLVKLAKSLGYDYEPAAIFHDVKQYTLSSIQSWFRDDKQIFVWCEPIAGTNDWKCLIRDMSTDTRKWTSVQLCFTYTASLEEGLRSACMILKGKENASGVLEQRT
jgi:hypothetical protein